MGVNSGGGLEIILDNEKSIGSFAYGGLMIDNFIFQSSKDAAYHIARWVKTEEGSKEGGEPPVACNFRWTRAGVADLALLAAVATGAVAALWSAIKAS
ncbi:hypothetical protein [Streptomyces sp. SID11385]|uniref:hypothetical protein n=1 Tax=Streptomyces sp. SID11385 TaxID=2706031 RepID=UPI0013C54778|nr:hypothetical protein [Streptomyces sp. SID11385]NEA41926.1 hypothetical protein [Streptomyces sp. SID11385]